MGKGEEGLTLRACMRVGCQAEDGGQASMSSFSSSFSGLGVRLLVQVLQAENGEGGKAAVT